MAAIVRFLPCFVHILHLKKFRPLHLSWETFPSLLAPSEHTGTSERYLRLLPDVRYCGTVWDTNLSNTPAHRVATSTLGEWPMLWNMCRQRRGSGSARYSARILCTPTVVSRSPPMTHTGMDSSCSRCRSLRPAIERRPP